MGRQAKRDGVALAECARRYVSRYGGTDLVLYSSRWSVTGWETVARAEGLDHRPTPTEIKAALALLRAQRRS